MKYMPHEYQNYCTEFIKEQKFCALFLEMGLGKTVSTLTAISDMLRTGENLGKVLVIAPLSVARQVWKQEIAKWDHTKHLTCSLILGTERQRKEAAEREADIYVVNRENIPWLVRTYGRQWVYNTLVIDELSSFKNPQAQRFRALRAVRAKVGRVIGLTGTPAPNGLIDLWSQIYILDGGERLEKHVTAYRRKYFYPAQQNGHIVYSWAIKQGAEDEIYRKISDIAISMRAKDHLDLPPRTDNIILVPFTERELKAYKRFEKEHVLELATDNITATNAAVLAGKLLQFTSGAVYNIAQEAQEIHAQKLTALKEMAESLQGQPTLVFYNFRHELKRIKGILPEAEELNPRTDSVERWNRGEIPVLLAHPASAGHGLNLQQGGHTAVWFGLTWSLEQYQQANARLDRQGQTQPVIIHHLITPGTIDEQVIKVLRGKQTLQEALLNAVNAAESKIF